MAKAPPRIVCKMHAVDFVMGTAALKIEDVGVLIRYQCQKMLGENPALPDSEPVREFLASEWPSYIWTKIRELKAPPGSSGKWAASLDVSLHEWRMLRLLVIDRDGVLCAYCGREDKKRPCIDHMVPLARGGGSDRSNLCVCCKRCNSSKGDSTPLEFIAKRMGW